MTDGCSGFELMLKRLEMSTYEASGPIHVDVASQRSSK